MTKYMNLKIVGIVAGMLLLAGCSNDEKVFELQGNAEGVKTFTSFTAILSDVVGTRAYFDDVSSDGVRRVYWQKGDVISVYSDTDTEPQKYILASLTEDNIATFTGEEVTGNTFYAVFAPSNKFVVSDESPNIVYFNGNGNSSVGDEFFGPMVATSTGSVFAFKQVTAVIRVTVGNVHQLDIVRLRGNNGEMIGGSGFVDISGDSPELKLDYAKNVNISQSLDYSFDDKYTNIYYVIPPTVFENGFTLFITGKDADENDFAVEKKYSSKLEAQAGTISNFSLVNISAAIETQEGIMKEDLELALTDAYATFYKSLGSWFGYDDLTNFVFGDIVGGDANKGSSKADQVDCTLLENFTITSDNSYIRTKWEQIYLAAKRANRVLNLLKYVKDSDVNVNQIAAQAKFIHAVWMFEGIRMFGAAIPYMTLADYEADPDNPVLRNVDENGNYIFIWNKVEEDLKSAIMGLPAVWDSNNYCRATSWMAKGMLAKLYVYWSSPFNGKNATANHWSEAKNLLDDIINNGVNAKGQKFNLTKNYGDLFDSNTYDSTEETIFDVQVYSSPSIVQPGALGVGGWGFYQPTYEFVNSFMVNDKGLPLSNYTDYDPLTQLNNDYYDPETDLSVYTDPRLDYSVGRFGVPYWDFGIPTSLNGWVRDYTNGGLYMNKKYQRNPADRFYAKVGENSKHYHVIRFADILLMRAECAIYEGDLSTALSRINQVRARAANDFVKNETVNYVMYDLINGRTVQGSAANYRIGLYAGFSSAAEAFTALKRERRAEFGMEGHRWFDIARWGEASTVLNQFSAYETQFFENKYEYSYNSNWVTFPIPFVAIVESEGLIVQNENWK